MRKPSRSHQPRGSPTVPIAVSASGELEWTASPEEAGTRLDVALAGRLKDASRSEAQKLIDAGAVTVDGTARPKRHRLAGGERVHVRAVAASPVTPVDEAAMLAAQAGVVFEDEHLLVVDKPAGVVVHPAPGHPLGTLAQALAGRAAGGSDPDRAGIVHRLDRDTSGLLVVARSAAVHEELQAMIRRREVRREYLALVEGRLESASGTIDAALGRDRVRRTVVSNRTDRPRAARTHFLQREALARATLLLATLDTGRTHQIRAHMALIGHPVCGDPQYGGRASGERLGLARQFLHSHRLGFVHPVTRVEVLWESVLPDDLRAALQAARVEQPAA